MTDSVTLCPVDPPSDQMKALYIGSFPPDERRPWADICANGYPRVFDVCLDNRPVGMLTYWQFDEATHGLDAVYIEHFAINPELRGKNIGARALEELKKRFAPMAIVLEAEHPDAGAMAVRRLGFYHRNGFQTVDTDYVQPPYSAALSPVPLYLLSTHGDTDAAALTRALHRFVYNFADSPNFKD